ncbi:MAG: alpha-glucan family phosphorylase, partial [Planctomycetota bacterium]|nr:alpha-glucan family phosphorylase [Planctomycetota bacterium]
QLERMRRNECLSKIKKSTVFTTHTPVPAGHDRYPVKLASKWLRPVLRGAELNAKRLAALGDENPQEPTKKEPVLCMTVLALNTANQVNGVSALHGVVSREMWQKVYDAPSPEEVPIGHVTNGVHMRTWLSSTTEEFYRKKLRVDWSKDSPDENLWKRTDKLSDGDLWDLRTTLRSELVHFVRKMNADQAIRRGATASEISKAQQVLEEDALTIGFARRFATYKRAPLLFKDIKRLERMMSDVNCPVQFVFAGKAHPDDKDGQAYAQKIFKMTQRMALRGRVVLLEDYDMRIGRMLTSGCDVWLNTPLRPHEASGTSGMKPTLHGGLNLSILDGWWPEAWNKKNGWAIGNGIEFKSRARQDTSDAESLYELLENEVIPLFHKTGRDGIPHGWVRRMRNSIQTVPSQFRADRMLSDYLHRYYLPAHLNK